MRSARQRSPWLTHLARCFSRHSVPAAPPGRRTTLQLEELESRWTPATLVNASTVSWNDVDGDIVTARLSKPLLTSSNAGSVFTFDQGSVNGDNSKLQTLQRLDLAALGAPAGGVGVTITSF